MIEPMDMDKKKKWLTEQGYREKDGVFYLVIRIFDYEAKLDFDEWRLTIWDLKGIKEQHRLFIKLALQRKWDKP